MTFHDITAIKMLLIYRSLRFRHRLMEIENHILSLTMEFEKQNIIISEWEAEKAKNAGDRKWQRKQQRRQEKNKKETEYLVNRIKRKSKRDNEGKPSSGDSKNSHFQETKSGLNGEIADIPKIVIQPSISDNEDDNDDIVKGKLLKVSKTPHKNINSFATLSKLNMKISII